MNLTGRPQTEEEQNHEHQSKLVRSLRDKGFNHEQIMDLVDVDGVDLDNKTARDILSYEDSGKQALSEMVSQTYNGIKSGLKYVGKSMYFPVSSLIDREAFKSAFLPFGGTIFSWGVGNLGLGGVVFGITGDENITNGYLLAFLGINAADGLYNIYKHKRDRIAEQKMSELEQITNGEDEEEK